ncbi:tetratricopeptide repeat protein [Dyella acidiphila]|uniref:Tetratricopeptide repeat protein n=1 Tax=Dyella acidiphila TaxID=2775866 RepID=A0ABR9G8S2_9GAMM|nr:hypothetical protein [Dyella acidiphila]MBE1160426.1 hypothetical protein [Dyella acidiphila]
MAAPGAHLRHPASTRTRTVALYECRLRRYDNWRIRHRGFILNTSTATGMPGSKLSFVLAAVAVILLIAWIYWPVTHAGFVWDDVIDFQKNAWLRHGDDWKQFLFNRFNDWANYFRPLGVAALTLEVRAFDVTPGPMHLTSLVMHLLDTLLVGLLALHLGSRTWPSGKRLFSLVLPMLVYGLHPLLVEPVVWIGCQYDLLATLFTLLGLLANMCIERRFVRTIAVALCFFLAACAKESAAMFPLMLVIFDWFDLDAPADASLLARLRMLLARNWPVYAAVFGAGAVYLCLRHWALGGFIPSLGDEPLPLFARLQEIAFLYVHYWHMFLWPAADMGPIHPVPAQQFLVFSAHGAINMLLMAVLVLAGAMLTLRRSYLGGLILLITVALLPVLHIIGVSFDASLYHERYAMTALAIACAWLPRTLLDIRIPERVAGLSSLAGFALLAVWLALSCMNVRAATPLWSTQIALWQWADAMHPDTVEAKDQLISAYMDAGYHAKAWQVIDQVMAEHMQCTNCMLNAASLAAGENAPDRASFFLDKIKNDPELRASSNLYRFYLGLQAEVLLLQHKYPEAEQMARSSIAMNDLDPEPQLLLALTLASEGKLDEAARVESTAIQLLPPDERAQRQQAYSSFLASLRTPAAGENGPH